MHAVDNRVCGVCYWHLGVRGSTRRDSSACPPPPPLLLQVPVNEPPTAISLSNSNVLEGSASALVGTFSCTDPENNACTFAITSATTLLHMVGTSLYTSVAIEQAQNPSVVLQIQATDNGSPQQTRTQSFTILVKYVRVPEVHVGLMCNARVRDRGPGVCAHSLLLRVCWGGWLRLPGPAPWPSGRRASSARKGSRPLGASASDSCVTLAKRVRCLCCANVLLYCMRMFW
jgi:hypothetical protein